MYLFMLLFDWAEFSFFYFLIDREFYIASGRCNSIYYLIKISTLELKKEDSKIGLSLQRREKVKYKSTTLISKSCIFTFVELTNGDDSFVSIRQTATIACKNPLISKRYLSNELVDSLAWSNSVGFQFKIHQFMHDLDKIKNWYKM